MIRSLYQRQDGSIRTELEQASSQITPNAEAMLWVDFMGEAPDVCEADPARDVKFHHWQWTMRCRSRTSPR